MKNIVEVVSEIKMLITCSLSNSEEIINNYNMGFITIGECSNQLISAIGYLNRSLNKFDEKDVEDAYIIINYEHIKSENI